LADSLTLSVSLPRRRTLAALGALAAGLPGTAVGASPDLPAQTQPGDLIFRRGVSAESALVRAVDGGEFSHVGLLLGAPGAWQVIHATPSEVPGRPDGVVVDALAFFLAPARSQTHAVYHVHASPEQRAQALQHAAAARGQPFRLADPAGTYCTLLIWRAWRDAGLDLDVAFTPLALPLMPGDYLLPTTLSRSRYLRRGVTVYAGMR